MPSSSSTTSTVVGGLCGSGLGMALTYVPSTTRASRAMLRAPMASSAPASLTAVRGISVGHWTDLERATGCSVVRSEEHTSELQSRLHLVCRLLLEKKKTKTVSNNVNISY